MIPKRIFRKVPAVTTPEVERFWEIAVAMHPDWEHVTYRDPVDPSLFPLTSHLWDSCETGAQHADLVRAEELLHRGGVYIDADVEVLLPFTPLLPLSGFAAWEDSDHIPNAVMGFEPGHPAIRRVVELAIERHHLGTWPAGVGVTTEVFKGRDDMLLLPPAAFYPVHYRAKKRADWSTVPTENPWAFAIHYWHASWLKK